MPRNNFDISDMPPHLREAFFNQVAEKENEGKQYREFCEEFAYNPAGFADKCLIFHKGGGLTSYQRYCMEKLVKEKRLCIRSLHGAGKSFFLAVLTHWFSLTRDGLDGQDWKLVSTASIWRQLKEFLWPEIHKIARMVNWDVVGRKPYDLRTELMALTLKLKRGHATAMASDNPDSMEGGHANSLLYILDEAKIIPAPVWDSFEGAFSGAGDDTADEAFVVAASTPGDTSGRFYDIHSKKEGLRHWATYHVTLEEAIAAGRASREWAENSKNLWGEDSALYQNKVLGNFATANPDEVVIPLHWVELAVDRHKSYFKEHDINSHPISKSSLDPALKGNQIIFAFGDGLKLIKFVESPKTSNAMILTGRAFQYVKQVGRMVVDMLGVGEGIVARLWEIIEEQELQKQMKVFGFRSSEKTDYETDTGQQFANTRSAAWWHMRVLLDPANKFEVMLPDHPKLIGDLTTPKYDASSSTGKIQVQSKEDIYKKLRRSTDYGDACVMLFWDKGRTAKREPALIAATPRAMIPSLKDRIA